MKTQKQKETNHVARKVTKKQVKENRALIANALEVLFASEYISKRRLYFENFMRGIFFSVGGIVGATVILGFILWLLSLFHQIPFVGPIVDSFRNTIESGSSR